MSTQVGMNTGVNTNLYQNNTTVPSVNPVMPNALPTNIFGNNNLLQPSVNNYEDDFLMPEYLKMSNINTNPYGKKKLHKHNSKFRHNRSNKL